MSSQEVNATAKLRDEDGNLTGEEITAVANYDFGDDLDGAVSLFGAETVFNQFKQSAVINLQGVMRRAISAGKNGDELQAVVSEWKPGVRARTAKSPADKIKDLLAGKSPEEIAAILQSVAEDSGDED